MDGFDFFGLVLEVNVQAEAAKRVLDMLEVKGIGDCKNARAGQFRESEPPSAGPTPSLLSWLLRKERAERALGFLLPVGQAELQIKPPVGQLGPMPRPTAFDDVQADLLFSKCGERPPHVPGEDAEWLGDWAGLPTVCLWLSHALVRGGLRNRGQFSRADPQPSVLSRSANRRTCSLFTWLGFRKKSYWNSALKVCWGSSGFLSGNSGGPAGERYQGFPVLASHPRRLMWRRAGEGGKYFSSDSTGGATENSPRREPWGRRDHDQAPEGQQKTALS